jgi:hypothetical protein
MVDLGMDSPLIINISPFNRTYTIRIRRAIFLRTAAVVFLTVFFMTAFHTGESDGACMSCLSQTGTGYTELACEGDSKFDVIYKCGEPDYTEETEEITEGSVRSEKPHSSFRAVTQRVEKLYYNCGQGRFIKILVFRGARLVAVKNGERGSGPQRCW